MVPNYKILGIQKGPSWGLYKILTFQNKSSTLVEYVQLTFHIHSHRYLVCFSRLQWLKIYILKSPREDSEYKLGFSN